MSAPSVLIAGVGYNPNIHGVADTPQRVVKLGMLPSRTTSQSRFIENYLSGAGKPPPDEWDLSPKAIAAIRDVKGNDSEGDCTIADMGNGIALWTGNDPDSGGLVSMTRSEALKVYHEIGGPGDNGLYMPDVKNYAVRTGILAGGSRRMLDGWCNFRTSDADSTKRNLIVFGGSSIGFMVPGEWMGNNTYDGAVWDTPRRLSFAGGHAVRLVGYNKIGVKVATWGLIVTMTWEAFFNSRIVTEGYVELAPSWYNKDRVSGSGFDVEKLKAALEATRGGQVIDWEPAPAPEPPPSPPPPPPPVPKAQVAKVGPVTVPFTVSALGGLLKLSGTATIPGQDAPVVEVSAADPMGFGIKDIVILGQLAWQIFLAFRNDKDLIAAINQMLAFFGVEPLPFTLKKMAGFDASGVSYWLIFQDLMAIAAAVGTKNFAALPVLVAKLLTDLGLEAPW